MAQADQFELRIEPMGWQLEVPADRPIVAAARDAGIELPASCRNGTCRACICMLVSGRVTYLIEWPGLSAEEARRLDPSVRRASNIGRGVESAASDQPVAGPRPRAWPRPALSRTLFCNSFGARTCPMRWRKLIMRSPRPTVPSAPMSNASRTTVNRRAFLRAAGTVAIGLPFLEGLPERSAWAAGNAPVFSMFMVAACGVVGNNFFPATLGPLTQASLDGRELTRP